MVEENFEIQSAKTLGNGLKIYKFFAMVEENFKIQSAKTFRNRPLN